MGYQNTIRTPFDEPGRRSVRMSGRRMIAIVAVCIVIGSILQFNEPEFDGAKIAAGTFPWPKGCPPRSYSRGDRLPHACFDRLQRISSQWASEHHMKISRSSKGSWYAYYRLGEDAVEGICIVWENDCSIGTVYGNLFLTDPQASSNPRDWRTVTRHRK